MKIAVFHQHQEAAIIEEIEKNTHLSLRIKTFQSCTSLFKEIQRFDVIITDVFDQDQNIIHMLKKKLPDKSYVIFVTSHEEMMRHCFGINVVSFLSLSELNQISLSLQVLDKKIGQDIFIKNQDSLRIISRKDILYIEYNLRDLYFYLNGGTVEKKINTNLNSLLHDLDSHFVLINRKQVVNLMYVIRIEKTYIEMINQKKLKISIRRKKELYQKLILMKGRSYEETFFKSEIE